MAALPPRLNRLAAAASLALVVSLAAGLPDQRVHAQPPQPRRIVSLIPATTEMLFTIGAQDRIVGVGAYDRFPPEVAKYPRVGGLLDPNIERILSLKPDLVIVYGTQDALRQQLERAGIPMFVYVHQALPDITGTIRAVGTRIGMRDAGEKEALRIEQQLAAIGRRVAGQPRRRTLLVFGREPGSLRRIDASGGYGFLHDILQTAGGENALADFKRQLVQVSTELLIARAPEAIIELEYGDAAPRDQGAELRVWSALSSIPAVRNRRIHFMVGDEFVVPGPRIVVAAERFARALHPGVFD